MSAATPSPDKTKALRDLDRLTGRFTSSEAERDNKRNVLQAAIVKHLAARSAPVTTITDHTPYDRVHVGRIGKEGGAEPLPKGPRPEYDPAEVAAATAELDRLTKDFEAAEGVVDKARKALHAGIAKHYAERHVGPSEMEKHTPYKRNRVVQIAREAGVPPIRGRAAK